MKNILPAPPIEITRTIQEKIIIIAWTWFLLFFVYGNVFYGFIEDLNKNGSINFGTDFESYQLIWGDHVFPNIIKLLIDVVISFFGGMTVGYLFTRARIAFKFFFSFFSSIVQHFLVFSITVVIISLTTKDTSYDVGRMLFYIIENLRLQPMYGVFLALGLLLTFGGYYFGIDSGIKIKEGDYLGTDNNNRNTFLDIKWYHWFWFYIPVSIYLQAILKLAFVTIVATINALKHWKWYNLFGVTTSTPGNEPGPDSISGILFWGYIGIIIVFFILYFIWELLSGRKIIKNKFVSSLIIFSLSFVLPLIICFIPYLLSKHK